jgi:hypothetical protein
MSLSSGGTFSGVPNRKSWSLSPNPSSICWAQVFYLKHDVSEVAFGFRLQVEYTQLGQIEVVSVSGIQLCLLGSNM